MRLRTEVSLILFKTYRQKIHFFSKIKTLPEPNQVNFIVWLCPLLRPNLFMEDEKLLSQQDRLDYISFLESGEAAYVLPRYNDFAYLTIKEGCHMGVLDILVYRCEKLGLLYEEENSDSGEEED